MMLDKLVESTLQKVVAVEPGERNTAVLFIRENGICRKQEIPFKPFIIINDPALFSGFNWPLEIVRLKGDALFAYLAEFPEIQGYEAALDFLKRSTGFAQNVPNAPFRVYSDPVQQILIASRFRLFRGMDFADLRRLQFDIETLTTAGFDFPNPEREADSIIIITFSDNTGWEKVVSAAEMSEKEMLQAFVQIINERDPDVIEGHNIFRFDLPYIETRAKRHKVKLAIGRGGELMRKRSSRFNAAERTINYDRYDVFGRHVADTYHQTIFYDISHRNLDSYGLKNVAKHFGVASPERTYIEGKEICRVWTEDRQRLLAYALDDVREVRAISDIFSPSYFFQTQLIPMKYQDCIVRGNATCIDALICGEYLAAGYSLSKPEPSRTFAGGLTRAFNSGIFKNVWHCDIRSLYPSIILAEKWCPSRDALAVFPRLLRDLRQFRLSAKDAEKKAATRAEKDYYNSLQTTFKVLINSFYGYLGFGQGTFNDYGMAERVAARGREILTMMLDFLNDAGANVIEMDTDGIYFQPPARISEPAIMGKMIQSVLPEGIEVELDDTYPAMFCYKSKNYALLEKNGEISITGAALKSRGLEPFQRDFMEKLITYLLKGEPEKITALTDEFRSAIETRAWPLTMLAKTETLSDSLDAYQKKGAAGEGRRSAAYELAIASGRDYRRGDQVSFYITGSKAKAAAVDNSRLLADAPAQRDENIPYYLAKLEELRKKLAAFTTPGNHGDSLF